MEAFHETTFIVVKEYSKGSFVAFLDLIQVNSEATPSCRSHQSLANDSNSSKEPGTLIIASNNDSPICIDDDPDVEIDVSFDLL